MPPRKGRDGEYDSVCVYCLGRHGNSPLLGSNSTAGRTLTDSLDELGRLQVPAACLTGSRSLIQVGEGSGRGGRSRHNRGENRTGAGGDPAGGHGHETPRRESQ